MIAKTRSDVKGTAKKFREKIFPRLLTNVYTYVIMGIDKRL